MESDTDGFVIEKEDGDFIVKECPYDDCGWNWKYYPGDELSVMTADAEASLHYERAHCGTARIRVVLEQEILLDAGDELPAVLDREHDFFDDEENHGYDVAYTIGEVIDEPDGDPDE